MITSRLLAQLFSAGHKVRSQKSIMGTALLFVCCLVPAAVSIGAAYSSYWTALHEAELSLKGTTGILEEHTRKVFETSAVVLDSIDEHIKHMDAAGIRRPETNDYLRRLKASLDHVVSIWIAGADGLVLAGSQDWEPGGGIANRDFFEKIKAGADTWISIPFTGRATSSASIAVSRRRSAPTFIGTIHLSISPAYFTKTFEEASGSDAPSAALLIRSDGEILARTPPVQGREQLKQDSPLLHHISQGETSGQFRVRSTVDGTDRMVAFRKVGSYPLYLAYGLDMAGILSPWYDAVQVYAALAILSAGLLGLMAFVVIHKWQAEMRASTALAVEHAQRIEAERRLGQMMKMDAIGQITGGIAHDFNNLLAAVCGCLELLRKRIDHSDEKGLRLLDTAMQGANRGAALTHRLLAFSRQQDLEPQVVTVPALVQDMTDLLQRSLTPAIRLAVSFPDNLPSLKADPNQLELALLNLVLNARDAMPLGGTISISGRTHSPTTPSHLGLTGELYVEVSVQDTGTGMDTATIQRAVEPFFTTKGIGKGTGLGLSMVKGFAEQSGGTIEIESQPHHGTSVRLYLPATMDHVRPDVRIASVGAGSTRSLTVLVVDDDPLVLAGTSAMLEDLGHVAVEANSGERALELLSGAAVDVVITDQVMPGMTGLELISQIQVKWPYVGIIIATGYTDVALTELRNVRRLTKPYFQNDLAQLLSAVAGPAKSNVISFR